MGNRAVLGNLGAFGRVQTGTWAGSGPTVPTVTTTPTTGSAAGVGTVTDPVGAARDAGGQFEASLVEPTLRLDERPRMSNYWPWWAGAAGLALITINYALVTDRSFGVSSAWDRVLHWRAERRLEKVEAQFTDERALAEALAAATAAHFGTSPGAPPPPPVETASADSGSSAGDKAPATRTPPVVTQAALLLSIFIGGWIAAVTAGRFELRFDMGEGFRDLVTSDSNTMIGVLFVGGILVGFGTRLAGGCSSGHGLNGCGRLRPVSIVATAVFFGTAVLVSFLLWKVI